MNAQICPACLSEAENISDLRFAQFKCRDCGSFIFPQRRAFRYDWHYHDRRGHSSSQIRKNKQQSLASQVSELIPALQKSELALEVGFGTGAFMELMKNQGHNIYAFEFKKELFESVLKLGFEEKYLATGFEKLQAGLIFDCVFYFDSFEHLLEPREHLKQLNGFSKAGSRALLVLPRADSFSHRTMGKFWPHNTPDHWIFYSQKGLCKLWEDNGWVLQKTFYPRKRINVSMIFRHLGLPILDVFPALPSFWFNFGEMGLVFEKR